MSSAQPLPTTADVTIRLARPGEDAAIARLAALDSSTRPAGPLLVALVGEELWAALSLETGAVVADPFRRSGELVALLAQRAAQVRGAGANRRTAGRRAQKPGRRRPARAA
jgi:hypothetical protein